MNLIEKSMKIALITACLAGVAHSKMAALALKKEAQRRGHTLLHYEVNDLYLENNVVFAMSNFA